MSKMEYIRSKKTLAPINDNYQYHGYNERYDYQDVLRLRVMYKHDLEVGYEEWHEYKQTSFYIR